LPDAANQTVKYRFARSPVQAEAGGALPYEAMLRDGLAKHGFVEGQPDAARYLVSVASATRPSKVRLAAQGECEGSAGSGGSSGCAAKGGRGLGWFAPKWTHTLTVRFFALPAGTEAYRVAVEKHDNNADAQSATPWLVAGALAQLPYAGAPQWRVSFGGEPGQAGAMPPVKSVKPVPQPPQPQ